MPRWPPRTLERVDPIEHPTAEAHGLEQERSRVATRHEFGGYFGERRALLDKSQRPCVFHIYDVLEFLNPRDRAAIDVVPDDCSVLKEVAKGQQHVLGEIGDGNHGDRVPGPLTAQVLCASM